MDRQTGGGDGSVYRQGTARAQYHLRQILVALDMSTVNQPEVMISNAAQRFGPDGRLTDEPPRQSVQTLLETLVQLAVSSLANKNKTG